MSFMEKLRHAKLDLAQPDADPLLPLVAEAVSGFDAVSTNAILTMVGLRPTTGNARKVAKSMRQLGYVPIVSRLTPPGGAASSACRGWARSPLREKNRRVSPSHGGIVDRQAFAGAAVGSQTVECGT